MKPLPKSASLSGLTSEVQRKLHKALDTPPQRGELLRELFTDVALEVDSRAQALLYNIEDSSEEVVSTRPDEVVPSLCFYEVLAVHYTQVPEESAVILPYFVKMWSQSFTSQIFALLFHKWLFEVPGQQSDDLRRYSTAFVEGAKNVFWIDIQGNERRFFSLYHYCFEEVALDVEHLNRLPIQAQRELILLLSRLFFFYEPAERLEAFLHYPPAFSIFPTGEPADVFVIEITDQLQKIKVELVLLQYLRNIKVLKGLKLHVATSTRLKSALYSFTAPGGPMYPTRPVRHTAWDTLDCLFPVGRHSRHLISLFFRLLHPYYWPTSFWNFILTFVLAIFHKLCAILESIWHWLLGREYLHHRQD